MPADPTPTADDVADTIAALHRLTDPTALRVAAVTWFQEAQRARAESAERIAALEAQVEAADALTGQIQDLVRNHLIGACKRLGVDGADATIDGGASDGDEVDFTRAELSAGVALIEEAAHADGVREGREEAAESDRLLVAIEEWTHDAGSQYVPTGGDADTFGDGVRRAQSRVRNILNTRRLPSPAAPPVAGPDTDLVEREAERIYNGWREKAGFKPWVPGGNSDAQDHARGLARAALLRTGGAS